MTERSLPVLVLGFMRFDGIKNILASCKEVGISHVYLALDGGKDEEAFKFQERALVDLFSHAEAIKIALTVRRRNTNAGLAVGVIEGISWFFENEEFGVILEDDLRISSNFFTFIENAREVFAHQSEIALVSGNNYFSDELNKQVCATHYPLIWGWATWRDRWDEFLLSLSKPVQLTSKRIPLSVNLFWITAAFQSRFGLVDSWAMSFSQYLRSKEGICVLPPQNLVSNFGVDSFAEHSNKNDPFINYPLRDIPESIDWMLPSQADITRYDSKLESFVYGISQKNILSPLKLLLTLIIKRNRISLKSKLRTARQKAEFTIMKGGS